MFFLSCLNWRYFQINKLKLFIQIFWIILSIYNFKKEVYQFDKIIWKNPYLKWDRRKNKSVQYRHGWFSYRVLYTHKHSFPLPGRFFSWLQKIYNNYYKSTPYGFWDMYYMERYNDKVDSTYYLAAFYSPLFIVLFLCIKTLLCNCV